jgi:hypothetical protein
MCWERGRLARNKHEVRKATSDYPAATSRPAARLRARRPRSQHTGCVVGSEAQWFCEVKRVQVSVKQQWVWATNSPQS